LDYTGGCRLWELNPPSPFYENGPFTRLVNLQILVDGFEPSQRH